MSIFRYHIYNDDDELIGYLYRDSNSKPGDTNLFLNPEDNQEPHWLERETCIRPLDQFLTEPVEVRHFDDNLTPLKFLSLNHLFAQLTDAGSGTFKKVTNNRLVVVRGEAEALKIDR